MNMDIPPQTLNDVYKTIAQRHETEPAKLPREKIEEDEFMAALAYNRGSPLIEPQDLSEDLIGMCRQSSRELDPRGMAEYRFVPLTIRGQTLLVISSCPWDPMMVEVISGYFPQCSQVRFALTSPQTLGQLLSQLQGEVSAPMAGYTSGKPAAPTRPLIPTAPPPPKAAAPAPPACRTRSSGRWTWSRGHSSRYNSRSAAGAQVRAASQACRVTEASSGRTGSRCRLAFPGRR
jgi:hypothetical protein